VNAQESFGCTALHYAATYSDVDTCKALISHNANVNLADNTGTRLSPLSRTHQIQ
jgi:ankyrin repeat protein